MSQIDPKKRGLGRGLSALLPTTSKPPSPTEVSAGPSPTTPVATQPAASTEAKKTYFLAGIEQLYPSPEQPRRIFKDTLLEELAASIKIHGVIMPLVVRPRSEGGYFIIAGERRWRAAQRAGQHDVPVVVQSIAPQVAFERALVENVQRADLSPIEEATAYQRLADQFGMTQEEIASKVGKDRSTIANSMRLLKLPPTVRQWVEDSALSMGHARALLALGSDAAIETAARMVIAKGLSVREAEQLAKRSSTDGQKGESPKPGSGKTAASKSPSAKDLEQRMTRALGGPVEIVEDAGGKSGTLQIRYLSLDHLDSLLDRLL